MFAIHERIDSIEDALALAWCREAYFDNSAPRDSWRYAWNSAEAIVAQYLKKGCW